MFSPIGNLPPAVYWRRRLFVVGAAVLLVLLIVLTVQVIAGGGDDQQPAAGAGSPSSAESSSSPRSAGSAPASSSESGATSTPGVVASTASTPGAGQSSGANRPTTPAPPARCSTRNLAVQAAVGEKKYNVGDKPVVSLQVTNVGARPCVQDLADKQIVLRLYNGQSRVWGSHDCEIQPGTTDRTLLTNQPVRVSITWSGSTSQQGCKGARQRVGAGTYTLYASLSGKSGKAASFTIS